MTFPADILRLAEEALSRCRERNMSLVTAESCTGGLVAGALTEIPGSSDVVDRGFVTYSNAAKEDVLGVPAHTLLTHGAVSEETVRAMALGAQARTRASIAVAVTGIAGPGGATPTKPVGRVHIAAATSHGIWHERLDLGDIGRTAVREETVRRALQLILSAVAGNQAGRVP